MFGAADDEVSAVWLLAGDGVEGGVERFGAAAGEDEFFGVAIEEGGALLAGGLDRPFDRPSKSGIAGGIGEMPFPKRGHGLSHLGSDGGGGVVVEVNHEGKGGSRSGALFLFGEVFEVIEQGGELRGGES